jgi:hypothetical protein
MQSKNAKCNLTIFEIFNFQEVDRISFPVVCSDLKQCCDTILALMLCVERYHLVGITVMTVLESDERRLMLAANRRPMLEVGN